MSYYQMIGEADPFEEEPAYTTASSWKTPAYLAPSRIGRSVASVQVEPKTSTSKADEAIARMLTILEKMENKQDFNKPAHNAPGGTRPAAQGLRRTGFSTYLNLVQCWECGKFGHYSNRCITTEVLLPEDKRNLRGKS
jgi:hypothetical protein